MGTSGVEDRGHAREVRRGVDRIVRGVARERGREEDLAHPRDGGGNGGHEDARRVTRLAPGRIDPGAGDGENARSELAPVVVGEGERLRLVRALAEVKRADAGGGDLEGRARGGRETRESGGAGIVAAHERGGASLVESLGEGEDRRVAPLAHGGEDGADVGLDAREVGLAPRAEPLQRSVRLRGAVDVRGELGRRGGSGGLRHRGREESSTQGRRGSVSSDA